nr:MAG TPA: hypothetical protein [Caudoviricetes sp.]
MQKISFVSLLVLLLLLVYQFLVKMHMTIKTKILANVTILMKTDLFA